MADPSPVDVYIDALPPGRREAMHGLRRAILAAAPGASETIAYQMPALRVGGRFLVSYAAFKRHYSLFPASDAVVEALSDELTPFLAGKGTIRFPSDTPIPLDLVTRIVEVRLREAASAKEG